MYEMQTVLHFDVFNVFADDYTNTIMYLHYALFHPGPH